LGAIVVSNNTSWTAEAEAKLKEIPFFVRPAARKKIEIFAQEQGSSEVNLQVYELAKAAFKR
jgi:transcription elongation factor GreA-like protein